MMHAVIVGNGVAGIEAALVLRARDATARITLISEESEHFFSRTALMYVLAGQLSLRDLEPHPRDLDRRLRLERVRARATGVDAASHALLLAGRPPLRYDRLLIATGSRPRPAPWAGAALRGIGHFVTLQDLAWLEEEVHGRSFARAAGASDHAASPYAARPSARAARGGSAPRAPLVVGGGLIGIEVVETLLTAGHRPTFAMRSPWFWPIALDARESAWVAEALRAHGVDVLLGANPERFHDDGAGNVAAVELAGARRACDLAVVAIGVVPNVEWLAGSSIRTGPAGIEVDEGLATSGSDVFAAGDCAALATPDGERRAEQLWYTARDQGRVAGARLAGERATYRRGTPYNSAKLMDIEYTTVGRVPAADGPLPAGLTDVFHEERGRVRSTTRFVLEGERVVGMNGLGRRWNHAVIARWIEEGWSWPRARAALAEAAFDTELVPPLAW